MKIRDEDIDCGGHCLIYLARYGKGFPRQLKELSMRDITAELRQMGIKIKVSIYPTLKPFKIYLLTVPSVNVYGQFHYVVVHTADGGRIRTVYDRCKQQGINYYTAWGGCCVRSFVLKSWASPIEIVT